MLLLLVIIMTDAIVFNVMTVYDIGQFYVTSLNIVDFKLSLSTRQD